MGRTDWEENMKNRINLSGMTNDMRHPGPGLGLVAVFVVACAVVLLLAAGSPPLQAQDYTPLEGLRVSEGGGVQYRAGFLSLSAGPGRCIYLSNSNLSGVVYTIHQSKWQRRTGSTWVDIPGTESEEGRLCGYSATSPGEYRVVAEISIDGERGYYSSENTLTVEGEAPSGGTGTIGTESFSIPDRGGWSTTSSGTAETRGPSSNGTKTWCFRVVPEGN